MPDGNWGTDVYVIVCGLHSVGLRTVEQLHQSRVPVVVVDDAPDPRLVQLVEGWGVTLIRRSARIGDGLVGAGLDRAQAVICVESDELTTLEIAMRVREARPDVRLVVLLANPAVGRALERVLGTGTILDPAALAAPAESDRAGIDMAETFGPPGPTVPMWARVRRRLSALRQSHAWGLTVVASAMLALLLVSTAVIHGGTWYRGCVRTLVCWNPCTSPSRRWPPSGTAISTSPDSRPGSSSSGSF